MPVSVAVKLLLTKSKNRSACQDHLSFISIPASTHKTWGGPGAGRQRKACLPVTKAPDRRLSWKKTGWVHHEQHTQDKQSSINSGGRHSLFQLSINSEVVRETQHICPPLGQRQMAWQSQEPSVSSYIPFFSPPPPPKLYIICEEGILNWKPQHLRKTDRLSENSLQIFFYIQVSRDSCLPCTLNNVDVIMKQLNFKKWHRRQKK